MQKPEPWSAAENAAIVDGYLWMLAEETAGRPYNKAAVRRELRAGALSKRSNASLEFKFRNISGVLEDHHVQWIEGYRPLHNFQMDLHDMVLERLDALELLPSHDGKPRRVRLG